MPRLPAAAALAAALVTATPASAITFSYTGTIVSWEVPATGTWEIVAVGAQGGTPMPEQQPFIGGLGALAGGLFELSAGTILQLAVGGMGRGGETGGGGGGGSFVVGPGATPLVIGGGGGGIRLGVTQNGWNANTAQRGLTGSGNASSGGGAELSALSGLGSPGQGGPVGALAFNGSGGAGFHSNGEDLLDLDFPGGPLALSLGGRSWANGLAGGSNGYEACDLDAFGGFGGGGNGNCSGGGGGWSGGQAGHVAGGGGSFNADTLTGWVQAGMGTGNGSITITLVPEVATPEPASAALSLLGLFALAAIRRPR